MTAHHRLHLHHHPAQGHLPMRFFAVEHPYAGDWLLVATGTLAALLLWYLNR